MRKILPTVFTEKDVDAALARLKERIMKQRGLKGSDAFYTPAEGVGVITGEYMELMEEYHLKNVAGMASESLDVATGAVWMNMTMEDYLKVYKDNGNRVLD